MTFPEILGALLSRVGAVQSFLSIHSPNNSHSNPSSSVKSPVEIFRGQDFHNNNSTGGIRSLFDAFEESEKDEFENYEDCDKENKTFKGQNRKKRKQIERNDSTIFGYDEEGCIAPCSDQGYCLGVENNGGSFLVCCDKCGTSYHVECAGYASLASVSEYWKCRACEDRKPPKRKGENAVEEQCKRPKIVRINETDNTTISSKTNDMVLATQLCILIKYQIVTFIFIFVGYFFRDFGYQRSGRKYIDNGRCNRLGLIFFFPISYS